MKWKLVPVEPTPEMVWKAEEESPPFYHGDPWYGSEPPSEGQVRAIYTAMLESAPTPPRLSDERILGLVKNHNYGSGCFYLPDGEKIVDFIRAIEREILGGNE